MVELFDEESIDRWTPLASPFDRTAAEQYVIFSLYSAYVLLEFI
jgi:hypothetical protein